MKLIDLVGFRFGKLTVVAEGNKRGRRRYWACRCDCGRTTEVEGGNLRAGASKACGRCRVASVSAFLPKHGASVEKGPTYNSWRSMRRRCRDPKRENAAVYLGLVIDPRWDDFAVFLSDMGERPKGMTIDRIDGAKGYSKDNCRWATPVQQTRNRRTARTFTWNGRTMPVIEWARELGISYGAAIYRVDKYQSLRLPDESKLWRLAT